MKIIFSNACFTRILLAGVLLAAGLPCHAFFAIPAYNSVIEFKNDLTGHRVLLTRADEIGAVDRGLAGPGWHRSGLTFAVSNFDGSAADVCRFYSPAVNSHFFTQNENECTALKSPGTGWLYEGIAFRAGVPVNETCGSPQGFQSVPVFRLYNNRAAVGDPSHRYTADLAVKQALIEHGWVYERVAFCVASATYTDSTFVISTSKVTASAACEDETTSTGSCIALNQLGPLTFAFAGSNVFSPLNGAPFVLTPKDITGLDGDIHTSVNSTYGPDIAQHSFAQTTSVNGLVAYGLYVNSRDRVGQPGMDLPAYASINPLYQFITTPPTTSTLPDRRIMPWRNGTQRFVELSFNLKVNYARKADAQSNAISHPTLELIDTRSRRNLYITLAGGQTVPLPNSEAQDYFAADVTTGKIIVSTSFRANPSFGKRVAGNSFFCATDATSHHCDSNGDGNYAFLLSYNDIAYIIAKARRLDTALSTNPADYAIDNFSFNNETSNNAELGVALTNYRLDILDDQF